MSTDFQTFDVSRTLAAPRARVFAAWTDAALKRRWFTDDGPDWETVEYAADLRVGGTERGVFRHGGGEPLTYEATYLDIVPESRLVYAYTMASEGRPFSASLSTVTLEESGTGTRLDYTEQAVFLDGRDSRAPRLAGTEHLLDQLTASLSEPVG